MNDTITVGRKKYDALRAKVQRLEEEVAALWRTDKEAFRAGYEWAESVGDVARERDELRRQLHAITMERLIERAMEEAE